jgi:hypothetical protein
MDAGKGICFLVWNGVEVRSLLYKDALNMKNQSENRPSLHK